mmetsp:Transcript_6316/g.13071  ORF Transcript_6316/g.13071 Transcript_6316/m.13071 type:complete len:276 (+) Transcript_6316:70-897(+)
MSNSYAQIGDAVNVVVLIASIVYLSTSIYFTLPGVQGVVDEHWKKDGFCIQNVDVPYWSSFDTCLYVDVLFSAIIYVMYLKWKDIPGMQTVSDGVPALIAATLGHGIAHGVMAVQLRDGTYQQEEGDKFFESMPLWQHVLGCTIFWCPLLKVAMPKVGIRNLVVVASIVHYGGSMVKKELGFPYVQTIVNVGFHVTQLMLPPDEKNHREYMTMPISTSLPLLVAWTEMLFCDEFFRSIGGHVLYDASIVVAFCMSYIELYFFHTKSNLAKKEKSA